MAKRPRSQLWKGPLEIPRFKIPGLGPEYKEGCNPGFSPYEPLIDYFFVNLCQCHWKHKNLFLQEVGVHIYLLFLFLFSNPQLPPAAPVFPLRSHIFGIYAVVPSAPEIHCNLFFKIRYNYSEQSSHFKYNPVLRGLAEPQVFRIWTWLFQKQTF